MNDDDDDDNDVDNSKIRAPYDFCKTVAVEIKKRSLKIYIISFKWYFNKSHVTLKRKYSESYIYSKQNFE